jgi:predicted RecA/RadA family phage recombinase
MNNYLQPGQTMDYTAPAGGVTSDGVYLIGAMFVVAAVDAGAGDLFAGATTGVYTLTKLAGEGALVEGQPVYWDVANARCSIDRAVGLPIGTIAAAALTGATSCSVRLHGLSLAGQTINFRKRFTIAQVNTGATLVAALPGIRLRLVDSKTIAVGGAVGATTTIDILGTLATVSRKLVAHAQASLTQSAVLRDGASGAAVLADGASYTANDAGAAITIGKTGADATTATHIDVILTCALE